MVELFQFYSSLGIRNAGPFCLKLETYLRMAHIQYKIVPIYDPRNGPKGKLPFIKDDGTIIGDSGIIIDYLKRKYGDPLDAHLSADLEAQALAIRHLIEDHLYWGIGHHSREEIYSLGFEDLSALSIILGKKPFLMGDQPNSIDACSYAFLVNILNCAIDSPLKEEVYKYANLKDYCTRMDLLFHSNGDCEYKTDSYNLFDKTKDHSCRGKWTYCAISATILLLAVGTTFTFHHYFTF